MNVTVLYNHDYAAEAPHDPGYAARADIAHVAADVAAALDALPDVKVRLLPCWGQVFRFVRRLVERPPDLVFNLCESLVGDSRGECAIPAILDTLGIPYTGSGALSLSLALHKNKAKELLRACGVSTPAGVLVSRLEQLFAIDLPFPLIVKPVREDGSVGITRTSVVHDAAQLHRQVDEVLRVHLQPALVERYIEGREVYVAMLGNGTPELLPFTEIDFSAMPDDCPRIVTYDAKWTEGCAEDLGTKPKIIAIEDPALAARIANTARAAFAALEMQDYGRVDLRVARDGTPYVIDLNPNCDLAKDAGFARAAAAVGLPYDALVARILELARLRLHADPRRRTTRPAVAVEAPRPHRELLGRGGRVRARARRAGARSKS